MRKLTKRQLLEIRRAAHENYLRRRLWPSRVCLAIEGRDAVIRTADGVTLRFPREKLFEPDCLRRLGF